MITAEHRNEAARERRPLGAALCLLAVLLAAIEGAAHSSPFSYLDFRIDGGRAVGLLTVHVLDIAYELRVEPAEKLLERSALESRRAEIEKLLKGRLRIEADGAPVDYSLERIDPLPDRQALALHLAFAPVGNPGVFGFRSYLFPYDPLHQTFLNVYENGALSHQEIFDRDHQEFDYFTGSRQGSLAVIRKFVPGGIYHIFTGPDHVLFLIGLMLLGGSMLRLLTIVTAFTVAHSVTLSLAALDILNPPSSLIEPVIALSIIYVGIDNLMVEKGGRDVRAWVAFFFGFIHGFGFAGVLKEFGLPPQALGWSLFSFNLGVEIGQAVIVVVVATVLNGIRRRWPSAGRPILIAGSICVIAAGLYWFIQRVFF